MKEQVRSQLDRLRREIETLPESQSSARAHLTEIVGDIEASLAKGKGDGDTGLADKIRRAIEEFEVEHPRATVILNDISNKLASMGI